MDRLLEVLKSSDKVTDQFLGDLERRPVGMDKFLSPAGHYDKVTDSPLGTWVPNNSLDKRLGPLAASKDKLVAGLARNETFAVKIHEALMPTSRNLVYQGQIHIVFTVPPLLDPSLQDLFPHREFRHLQHHDELQYLQTHSLDLKLVMARPEASNSALTTIPNARKAVVGVAALAVATMTRAGSVKAVMGSLNVDMAMAQDDNRALTRTPNAKRVVVAVAAPAVVTMTAVLLQDQHTTGWEVLAKTERNSKRRGRRGKRKS